MGFAINSNIEIIGSLFFLFFFFTGVEGTNIGKDEYLQLSFEGQGLSP